MTVKDWIELGITVIFALPGIITAIIAVVKLIKNNNWSAIKELAKNAIKQVEDYYKEHPDMTSEQKLEMAVGIVKTACESLTGVQWNDKLVENIKKYINKVISWSNSISK